MNVMESKQQFLCTIIILIYEELTKVKIREFNKKMKEESPDKILSEYMTCKIYLTEKQLEKVCEKSSHHGACNTKEVKK